MTVIQKLNDAKAVDMVLQRAKDKAERQIGLMRVIAGEVISENLDIVVGVNGSVAPPRGDKRLGRRSLLSRA